MNLDIQRLSQIPASSTVLQLCPDELGRMWAASPAGLFRIDEFGWSPVIGSFPLAEVGCVLSLGKTVWASGLDGDLVFSRHAGDNWQNCILEQSHQAVICMCASPNFQKDHTILAGTAGDGILRSVDGGHVWQLVNFGLRDFSVYSLVCAGWQRKEPVFAATSGGVYSSPNGGRAWRFSGLEGKLVLCLAIHPDFEHQPVILAGTDGEGLFRSQDAGKSWQPVTGLDQVSLTINSIIINEDLCLLATSEAGIYHSQDAGVNWSRTGTQFPPILNLARLDNSIYAATYGSGVFSSQDGGLSWVNQEDWVAQRFANLVVLPGNQGFSILAGSLQSGLWMSENKPIEWREQKFQEISLPVFALCAGDQHAYVGSETGIYRLPATQKTLEVSLTTDQAVISLACFGRQVLAGSLDGKLWMSGDMGVSWQQISSPAPGLPVAALDLRLRDKVMELFVAIVDNNHHQVQVWHAQSNLDASEPINWELWLNDRTNYGSVVFADQVGNSESVVAIGNAILFRQDGEWQRFESSNMPDPIRALVHIQGTSDYLAAAGTALFTINELDLEPITISGSSRKVFVSIFSIARADGQLSIFGLTSNGELHQVSLEK